MANSKANVNKVMGLLAPLGKVSKKSMFGGHGFFLGGRMFALMGNDVLYFRADDENRGDYEAVGMESYGKMPYFRAPSAAMETPDQCTPWARGAVSAAYRAGSKSRKKSARA